MATEIYPIISQNEANFKAVGVLVTGKRYAGKDTFCALLQEDLANRGITSVIRSTAYQLKQRFCTEFSLDLDAFIHDRMYKETHRLEFANYVQTQSQAENFKNFISEIKSDLDMMQVIIISDLRNVFDQKQFSWIFPAFLTIKINATDEVRESRGLIRNEYDKTEFETEIPQILVDEEVFNNGTIANLSLNVTRIVKSKINPMVVNCK
jgi:phosphomevalonate kinase